MCHSGGTELAPQGAGGEGRHERILRAVLAALIAVTGSTMVQATSSAPASAATNFKMPWASGEQWRITQGRHETNAWDIQPAAPTVTLPNPHDPHRRSPATTARSPTPGGSRATGEPCDRGAVGAFHVLRQDDLPERPPGADELPFATERFVRSEKSYRAASRVDHTGPASPSACAAPSTRAAPNLAHATDAT